MKTTTITTKRDQELKVILEKVNKNHMPLLPFHVFDIGENNLCYVIAQLEQTALEILIELRNPHENTITYRGSEFIYFAKLAKILQQTDIAIQYDQIYQELAKLVDQRWLFLSDEIKKIRDNID